MELLGVPLRLEEASPKRHLSLSLVLEEDFALPLQELPPFRL